MVNRRCVKDTYDRGECVGVVTKWDWGRVGYGVDMWAVVGATV